jgi:signal transduction histidine kinase/CheY-like chemotaxis protein
VSRPGPNSERALILAPNGRDAQIAATILLEAGYPAHVTPDLPHLQAELDKGAGLAILAEEAVQTADLRALVGYLANQPAWSDFPIVLLTRHGGGPERNPFAARLAEALGNVSFLERPFHPTTLASVVSTAVRGRRRQYEARTRLTELSEERAALAELTHTLEARVKARSDQLLAEVAAREQAQDQLRQAQKMESIGQLTGGVAHDFNNLLMAVIGNLDLLKKRVPDEPKLQRLIDGAMQGARRGAALTQRLLAFARQQDLTAVPVDLAELLRGMSELLDRSLGPLIALRFDLPDDLPAACVDSNQVELAILNLAINARDAMADGGEIRISLDCTRVDAAGAIAPGDYLRVSLADTGTGMDEATLKKAIEPFFSTKPIGKGTGLGLSMVHGLAVQLGGRLELASTPGEGTTAVLWLPAAAGRPEAPHAPEADYVGPRRIAVILVVDDDPLVAVSTVEMLADLGHEVIGVESGAQALEVLRDGRRIDLLVTDHAMPEMSGTELARCAQALRPSLPILLATGYAEPEAGETLALPRLTKPFHQAELRAEVDRLLDEPRGRPSPAAAVGLHGADAR